MKSITKDIIISCEEDPTGIFPMINRGEFELVDYLLDNGIVNINTVDSNGNDVLVRLLKVKEYNLVLKYIKKKNWDVNHQNKEGDTFGHILASDSSVSTIKIIDALLKKTSFMPNIRNYKGETLFDRANNNNYLITSLKILEDKRFTNIDLYDFKSLCDSIFNNKYGKYSMLSNFNLIINSMKKKPLLPNMQILIDRLYENKEAIKLDINNNSLDLFDKIFSLTIEEIGV